MTRPRRVRPKALLDDLVLLGATAAQGIFGSKFRVTVSRGVPQESDLAEFVVARSTRRPSSAPKNAVMPRWQRSQRTSRLHGRCSTQHEFAAMWAVVSGD